MRPATELEKLAYLALALRNQELQDRRNGRQVPAGLSEFVADVLLEVTEGQGRSVSARSVGSEKAGSREVVTLLEAAQMLGVSLATVKRRVASGDLAAMKDGRIVRIALSDINAYIEQHKEFR